MAPTHDDDTAAVLGVLLHQLASPLGAIANYVHVLPDDELGCKEGLVDAATRAGGVLDEARGWIDAARSLESGTAGAVDMHAILDAASARRPRPAGLPDGVPHAHGHAEAVRWLVETLLTEAELAWPDAELVWSSLASARVQLRLAPRQDVTARPPERQGDRMLLAAALARRLGGSVVRTPAGEGLALVLELPMAGTV